MLLTLLSNLPGMAYRCRNQKSWIMEFVSQGCLELTGYRPADLLEGGKMAYGELIHPQDQQWVFEQVQAALCQQQPFQLTYRIRTAAGAEKWVWEKGCGVFGPDGKLLALEGFISDITEQKQAEATARQSMQALERAQAQSEAERKLLHSLLWEAPAAIAIVRGPQQVLEFANPLLEQLFPARLKVGQPIEQSLVGLPATPFLELLGQVYLTGEAQVVKEMPIFIPAAADGKRVEAYYNILFKALPDARGKTYQVLIFCHDVTEQVQARKKVEESQARLQRILNSLPQIAWTFLPESPDIEFFNQRWYSYTGLSQEQCQAMGWLQALHPQDREGVFAFRDEWAQKGEARQIANRYRRYDREYRWHLIQLVPVRDAAGQIVLWIGTATDIDDQKLAQQHLEDTLKALQEKNFELDQFVYKTSHDLRAPLATILGLVTVSKQEPEPIKKDHYLDLIENRVHKLDGFIGSMLDYSRNTRTATKMEPIALKPFIEDCIGELKYMRHFDRLRIATQVEVATLNSDGFRLRIIFSNLISNAVKYQDYNKPESHLTISITSEEQQVEIRFRDNGIGIAAEYQDRLFGMFFRASEHAEGSGLGLYIVKQAVAMLEGTLHLESELGQGSEFVVRLPQSC